MHLSNRFSFSFSVLHLYLAVVTAAAATHTAQYCVMCACHMPYANVWRVREKNTCGKLCNLQVKYLLCISFNIGCVCLRLLSNSIRCDHPVSILYMQRIGSPIKMRYRAKRKHLSTNMYLNNTKEEIILAIIKQSEANMVRASLASRAFIFPWSIEQWKLIIYEERTKKINFIIAVTAAAASSKPLKRDNAPHHVTDPLRCIE